MKTLTGLLFLCIMIGFVSFAAHGADNSAPLMIATTTSLMDTGFVDKITSMFTKKTGIQVKAVAVGTGEALKMGERGDVDVLLVHAKPAEEQFMKNGFGITRKEFMYNYFMIAGPKDDPAGIKSAKTAEEAFKRIASKKCTFVSRADNSGTHKKEKEIWKNAGLTPEGSWYMESGAGMAQTLRLAHEKNAYTLTDESTFNVLKGTLDLEHFAIKTQSLKNIYSIILINPKRFPRVNYEKAQKFDAFLWEKESRRFIKNFKDKQGNILFFPCSTKRS